MSRDDDAATFGETGPNSPRTVGHRRSARAEALKVLISIARWAAIAAVVVFAIFYFAQMWPSVERAIHAMDPARAVTSFLVLMVGLVFNALAWTTILRNLGHRVPFLRGAQIMLVGQLGKYVPGSVWAYLLQMEIGRQYGVNRARVLVTSLYAAGIGVVCSLLLGALTAPRISQSYPGLLWLLLLLPASLFCLHPAVMTRLANLVLKTFRRPPLEERVQFATVATAVGWGLASYLTYGLHLWLLADEAVPLIEIGVMSAAISLGFTAGLFAILLPSGVGVREAVLITVLTLLIPPAEAAAISLVSRGMFTMGDLLMAGMAAIAAFAVRKRLRAADAELAEYPDVASPSVSPPR